MSSLSRGRWKKGRGKEGSSARKKESCDYPWQGVRPPFSSSPSPLPSHLSSPRALTRPTSSRHRSPTPVHRGQTPEKKKVDAPVCERKVGVRETLHLRDAAVAVPAWVELWRRHVPLGVNGVVCASSRASSSSEGKRELAVKREEEGRKRERRRGRTVPPVGDGCYCHAEGEDGRVGFDDLGGKEAAEGLSKRG